MWEEVRGCTPQWAAINFWGFRGGARQPIAPPSGSPGPWKPRREGRWASGAPAGLREPLLCQLTPPTFPRSPPALVTPPSPGPRASWPAHPFLSGLSRMAAAAEGLCGEDRGRQGLGLRPGAAPGTPEQAASQELPAGRAADAGSGSAPSASPQKPLASANPPLPPAPPPASQTSVCPPVRPHRLQGAAACSSRGSGLRLPPAWPRPRRWAPSSPGGTRRAEVSGLGPGSCGTDLQGTHCPPEAQP